ncbi:putative Ntn-hydrolase superfamily protein [Branchiibius hedensis]|uniref:Uncharacterized conserved protein, Ntn-hydrolase superfamily n=1 Tax=Branchiibius hedensis TaxID=672460 RepID=A0A2Y9BU83_9MICO|nr:DUF1028 domain-containing protein [Branchiibius hedensis]PWJ26480.1 putative Ntn-hydrolase superfamily protein [Branchiibius hedensis]SSA35292.1 Uncharacterized conserved protein, Ntn-hydrolase superfamily [Branchiibius hedensis]
MTFSIVARDAATGDLGVAVASKFLAVGAAVPAARFGIGAVATQALCNTLYKRDGLARLAEGLSASDALAALTAADDRRETRQAGMVDSRGGSATFTGTSALPWAGGRTGPNVAIQGNILTGPDVVDAMYDEWLATEDLPLVQRLLRSLEAGDVAGGDSRGRQSAALLVVSKTGSYTPGDDVIYDLRVDDHVAPIPELARLLQVHDLLFGESTDLLPLDGELADEVATRLSALGYADLDTWAGVENLELRLHPGQIDVIVLGQLRAVTAAIG